MGSAKCLFRPIYALDTTLKYYGLFMFEFKSLNQTLFFLKTKLYYLCTVFTNLIQII